MPDNWYPRPDNYAAVSFQFSGLRHRTAGIGDRFVGYRPAGTSNRFVGIGYRFVTRLS